MSGAFLLLMKNLNEVNKIVLLGGNQFGSKQKANARASEPVTKTVIPAPNRDKSNRKAYKVVEESRRDVVNLEEAATMEEEAV